MKTEREKQVDAAVKAYRKGNGSITQAETARGLGISQPHFNRLLKARGLVTERPRRKA